MALRELNISLGLQTGKFAQALKDAEKKLNRFGRKAEFVGKQLATRLTLPLAGAAFASVKAAIDFEKLENSLGALASAADPASDQMKRLQDLAKLPGIALPQAVKGSIRLQSVGFAAQEAEAFLTQMSKAVTLVGGSADDLDAVTTQFAQMSSKGKILAEDFQVIRERLPAINIALQDAFGTTNIEAIRDTGISTKEFTGRIIQAISQNEKFQSVQGGLANSFNNFQQSIQASLVTMGKAILESVDFQKILDGISGVVETVTTGFSNLSPATKKITIGIAAMGATIGPLLVGLGALAKTLPLIRVALATLTGPVGLTVAGLSLAAVAFTSAYQKSERFRVAMDFLGATVAEVSSTIAKAFSGLGEILSGNFTKGVKKLSDAASSVGLVNLFAASGARVGKKYAESAENAVTDAIPDIQQALQKAFQFDEPISAPSGVVAPGAAPKLPDRGAFEQFATIPPINPAFVESIGVASERLNEMKGNLTAVQERVMSAAQVMAAGAVAISESLKEAALEGATSLNQLANAALSSAAKFIRAQLLQAVAAQLKNILASVPFPFNIALASGVAAVVTTLFNAALAKIAPPKLAGGGIVPEGFPNDTFPALLSSREAVIPLDRLPDVTAKRETIVLIPDVRIKGSDLVLSFEREIKKRERVRGF